jgi:hypothetical protein
MPDWNEGKVPLMRNAVILVRDADVCSNPGGWKSKGTNAAYLVVEENEKQYLGQV